MGLHIDRRSANKQGGSMSKPSAETVMRRIHEYFVSLCTAKGWKPFPEVHENAGIYRFSASRVVKVVGFPWTDVELRIEFVKADRGAVFLIEGMNFHSDGDLSGGIFLDPVEFLIFHGKEFCSINPDVENQNCWHIAAPKDLDAFFEGYDRLAQRLGYVTLF
ncbi:hypothetical protein A2V61_00020 [Candidatus Woesebacteria bacterium RBG_19FT_COMBO_47_8]|uniref:Uncharacterized protein n=1 Tax=Candidatus Woesebacteria bacterium RBG_13_46_13 TaxID=1802479 RepID=A0A1F7X5Q6_9BACT|nr:MAG: hypothetical protein A2Y68_03750 [Candidatus Woesebacteria bacterium RBG_13_46_13]OGM17847.1 MAG: hypothetical protein A2V61_00020 [Candidatus Woesebacteria bacterium RBG_19FT_COMBO_47_8]